LFAVGGISNGRVERTAEMMMLQPTTIPENYENYIEHVSNSTAALQLSADSSWSGWKLLPPMNNARFNATVVEHLGKIIVCGGNNGVMVMRSVEVFDMSSKTWMDGPPLRRAREAPVVVCDGRRLHVHGGLDLMQRTVNVNEFWDVQFHQSDDTGGNNTGGNNTGGTPVDSDIIIPVARLL